MDLKTLILKFQELGYDFNAKFKGVQTFNSVKISGCTIIHGFILFGNVGVIKIMIESGADVNMWTDADSLFSNLRCALCLAIAIRALEIVKLLVEAGADLLGAESRIPKNLQKYLGTKFFLYKFFRTITPIRVACAMGDPKILEYLLQVSGKAFGRPKIRFCSIELGRIESVNLFLKDCSLDFSDDRIDSRPALHVLFERMRRHTDVSRILELIGYFLEGNYDLNAAYDMGNTLLHIYAQRSNSLLPFKSELDILLSFLLENGAQVDEMNFEGKTPLLLALALDGRKDGFVKMLLAHNAVVNLTTALGFTPLHHAIAR
jgi:ankyrin repeat protein